MGGDGIVGEGGRAVRSSISEMDGADKMRVCVDTHQTTFCKPQTVVAGLGSNGDRSWGTRDVPLERGIAMVSRVRMHGPFARRLTQVEEPPLVAGELRLLLAKYLAVVRIVFGE